MNAAGNLSPLARRLIGRIMCTILFAYDCHPRYQLVVAANRDEFYERPTAPAAFGQITLISWREETLRKVVPGWGLPLADGLLL